MYIKKANKDDIPAIKYLLERSGKYHFKDSDINSKDVSWCVRTEEGILIGYIWCGFMSNGKTGLIDHFCVDPQYSGQHIARDLCLHLCKELVSRKVQYVLAYSIHDKDQIKVLSSIQKAISGHKAEVKVTPGFMIEIYNQE